MSNPEPVSFREAAVVWGRVALQSFGGPAAQIAVMHRIVLEEKRWVSEQRFLHALNFCMLLPGPEAMQLATYLGWLLHGVRGGLLAGVLFILPGFLAMLALSLLYAAFQSTPVLETVFYGLQAAILAVVVEAVLRIGRRVLKRKALVVVAACAFVALFAFAVPFPLLVGAAALVGWMGGRWAPAQFQIAQHGEAGAEVPSDIARYLDAQAAARTPTLGGTVRTVAVWATVWLLPVGVILAVLPGSVWATVAVFFSQVALVTFGGAYAVLVYLGQQAVTVYGWLTPDEMLHGLGLAETTPGPLIMVVQFVGFLATFRTPGTLDPYLAGLLGSVLTTWVTFAPSFLWIFAGAPYIETLRKINALTAALSALTAAVVGVILNLAVWFALHTLFGQVETRSVGPLVLHLPTLSTLDAGALSITVVAFVALFRLKLGLGGTLLLCTGLGILWKWLLPG